MKYTILGLDQQALIDHEIKIQDAAIIKKIAEIFTYSKTYTVMHEDEVYYWIKVDAIIEDYPVLGLKKQSLIKRLKALVDKGIFKKHIKNTPNGIFSYYRGTEILDSILNTSHLDERLSGNYEHLSGDSKRIGGNYERLSISSLDSSFIDNPLYTKERETPPPKKKFSPPTLEDVKAHMKEKIPTDNGFEEEQAVLFISYYESNGWKVGNNKMVNWKSACTGWLNRMKNFDRESKPTNTKPFNSQYSLTLNYTPEQQKEIDAYQDAHARKHNKLLSEAECWTKIQSDRS